MSNYFHLNLDLYPLKKSSTLDLIKPHVHTKIPASELNQDLINFLASKDIYIYNVQTFSLIPDYVQPIHIDGQGGDIAKINFLFGGNDSLMQWYKEKPGAPRVFNKTPAGTLYQDFSYDQVEILESCTLKFPSLVQVGIPHNLINKQEHLICISILLADINSNLVPVGQVKSKLEQFIE